MIPYYHTKEFVIKIFFCLKNDMIYLIDEKGFIQKSYQYKQGYYKIISLNGDIHVGILKSNLFQVKGNLTQFFDQLYFDNIRDINNF